MPKLPGTFVKINFLLQCVGLLWFKYNKKIWYSLVDGRNRSTQFGIMRWFDQQFCCWQGIYWQLILLDVKNFEIWNLKLWMCSLLVNISHIKFGVNWQSFGQMPNKTENLILEITWWMILLKLLQIWCTISEIIYLILINHMPFVLIV